jgi:hypothetical protein
MGDANGICIHVTCEQTSWPQNTYPVSVSETLFMVFIGGSNKFPIQIRKELKPVLLSPEVFGTAQNRVVWRRVLHAGRKSR